MDLVILLADFQDRGSEIDMPGSKGLKKIPSVWLPIFELEKKIQVIPSRITKVGMDQRASMKLLFCQIGSYRLGTTFATGLTCPNQHIFLS